MSGPLTHRVYFKGSMESPVEKRRGPKAIYKHFDHKHPLYYKDGEDYYCLVDDKRAKGYVLKDQGAEQFIPHDWDDLIFYEEASRLAKQAGIYFPKISDKESGHRTPPPLLHISETKRKRPAWNRSAILRHIDETLRRKNGNAR